MRLLDMLDAIFGPNVAQLNVQSSLAPCFGTYALFGPKTAFYSQVVATVLIHRALSAKQLLILRVWLHVHAGLKGSVTCTCSSPDLCSVVRTATSHSRVPLKP